MPKAERRKRRFVTLRLYQADRELLQHLGRGRADVADRYEALCALPDIVKEMKFPDLRKLERRPIRIGIPAELEVTIKRATKRTGQPFVTILLEAAREYRRRYPLQPAK